MRPNIKLILLYTLAAGLLAALTSPIPGTSLLLTGLEILMVVHLARKNNFDLTLKTLGFSATAIWGVSSVLKDAGLELLRSLPSWDGLPASSWQSFLFSFWGFWQTYISVNKKTELPRSFSLN